MPGIWQLVEIEAPGYHVAGATLAGVPGVVLGHNDRLAWGATDAAATSPRVYTETFTSADGGTYRIGAATAGATARNESFLVRGTAHATRTYYTTRHGFVLEPSGIIRHAVQWVYVQDRRSPLSAFFALDRARSIDDAVRALAQYPGPTENFALADVSGQAGYTQAGRVPDDAAWGLHAYDGRTSAVTPLRFVPFTALPHVDASRGAFVVSANNLPYGAGYRYRLSPSYPPPYRANEIRRALGTAPVSVASAHRAQTDLESIAERELAQRIVAALKKTAADRDPAIAPTYAALAAFDGRMTTDSRGATAIQRIRTVAVRDLIQLHLQDTAARGYLADGPVFVTLLRALREHPRGWFPRDDVAAFLTNETRSAIALYGGSDTFLEPYGSAYAVTAQHPFAAFGFPFFDGPRVAGRGGSYAPAVQGLFAGQSFRAIWDVGNWDAGGIDIPIGESGEPGSPHYRDLAAPWAADALTPLPYSDAAVTRAATATLTLTR
jgi:penicillin amidase